MFAPNPPMTGFIDSLFNQIGKLSASTAPIVYTSRQTDAPKPVVNSSPQGNQPVVIEQPKSTLEKIISTIGETVTNIFSLKYGHANEQPKAVRSNSQRPAQASPYVFITKDTAAAKPTQQNYNWLWLILIALVLILSLRRK